MAGPIADLLVKMDVDSAKFRQEIGFMRSGLASLSASLDKMNDRIKQVFTVAAIYKAGQAFKSVITDAVDSAAAMNGAAERIGMTTESLSRLTYAAKMSGIEQEALTTSLTKFIKHSQEAASGSKSQADAYKAIGISIQQLRSLSTEQLLSEMAESFSQMENDGRKAALSMEFFGKSGAVMVPLLNQGRDGIAELAREADALGATLDTKTARAAAHFNDNLDKLHLTSKTFGKAIFNELAPALNVLTDQMVEANKVYEETSGFVEAVAVGLKAVVSVGVGVAHVFSEIWNELGMIGAQAVVVGKSLGDYFKGNEMAGHIGSFREVEREYASRIKRIRDQRTEFLNALWNPQAEIQIDFGGSKRRAPTPPADAIRPSFEDMIRDERTALEQAGKALDEQLASPQEKLDAWYMRSAELADALVISTETLERATRKYNDERAKLVNEPIDRLAKQAETSLEAANKIAMSETSRENKQILAQWKQVESEHKKFLERMKVDTVSIAGALSSTLANQIASGFRDGMRGVFDAFMQTMIQIGAQIAANQIIFGAFSAGSAALSGGPIGSGFGGSFGTPTALTAGAMQTNPGMITSKSRGATTVRVVLDPASMSMTLSDWLERTLASSAYGGR